VAGASVAFGVYDPHGDFKNDASPAIEHVFMPWEEVDLSTLDAADSYALAHQRALMVTIEPWSWLARNQKTPDELYNGIMNGSYDANMDGICAKAAQLKNKVTIRLGQEMDEKSGQFIWSPWTPEQFVNAFRHVVTECHKYNKDVRFLWSPSGNAGVEAYYPGDEYVDIVGLSLFALQKRDHDEIGRDRTFEEMLTPLYGRVARFGKPIYIAEFGYEGDAAYLRDWSMALTRPMSQFPLLKAVVYFNDKEVYPWPGGYGLPNWRVTSNTSVSKR
jgi:beta-mannanase